jgi:hypothetical protein
MSGNSQEKAPVTERACLLCVRDKIRRGLCACAAEPEITGFIAVCVFIGLVLIAGAGFP